MSASKRYPVSLEVEALDAVPNPSPQAIEEGLRALRTNGPSTFAVLWRSDSFVQTAGSGAGCLLERGEPGRKVWRAFQDQPVVPFEDGTQLFFNGGRPKLSRNEWFSMWQVIEVFQRFAAGDSFPDYVRWRDISHLLKRTVDT